MCDGVLSLGGAEDSGLLECDAVSFKKLGNTFPITVSYTVRDEDSKLYKFQYHLCFVVAEGKTIDATQEMIAIGMCNVVSSFVSSMPVTGAISRGAVNNASGVQTTFGGVYTGM
jgi:hypothetical protein